LLAHAISFEGYPVGIVDNPVEYGIGDSCLADHVVPVGHGELSGDQRGSPPIEFLEDFEQIEPLLIAQRVADRNWTGRTQ
jgi:hypothetical protein